MNIQMGIRRKILLLAFLLFIVVTGGTLVLRESYRNTGPSEVIETTRFLMGTSWTIKVPLQEGWEKEAVREAVDASFDELARIEALMSEWRENTPISRINLNAGVKPTRVPDELMRIIERGIE